MYKPVQTKITINPYQQITETVGFMRLLLAWCCNDEKQNDEN